MSSNNNDKNNNDTNNNNNTYAINIRLKYLFGSGFC